MSELTRLSDHDFELLARDLLSAELGIRLESFARGRDKGIDLRYLAPPGNLIPPQVPDIVVQCKHYANTGYSGLNGRVRLSMTSTDSHVATRRIIESSVLWRLCRARDSRHTFGTHAALFGVNPWRLQSWMGHKRSDVLRHVDVDHPSAGDPGVGCGGCRDRARPDRRILKMLGARGSRVAASRTRIQKRLPKQPLRWWRLGGSNP